jgi:hypothetical protein
VIRRVESSRICSVSPSTSKPRVAERRPEYGNGISLIAATNGQQPLQAALNYSKWKNGWFIWAADSILSVDSFSLNIILSQFYRPYFDGIH